MDGYCSRIIFQYYPFHHVVYRCLYPRDLIISHIFITSFYIWYFDSVFFPTGIGRAIKTLLAKNEWNYCVIWRRSKWRKDRTITRKEGEGWLVKPPQIKHWHLNEPYAEDDRGLLAEHPMNLGTPIPALFTTKSIIILLKNILLSIAGVLLFIETNESMALIPILALGFLGLVINYNRVMKWRKIVDLPTSTIRGAAVGRLEVFGQLRPRKIWPPTIFVDNDPSKELFGMGIWSGVLTFFQLG